MYSLKDELKEALENCSGKVIEGEHDTIAAMVHAFNGLYKGIVVSFVKTPANANIVVKDAQGKTVAPEANGTYRLAEGVYSYSATADGYTPVEDQELILTATDVAAGTKTVTVTLVAA